MASRIRDKNGNFVPKTKINVLRHHARTKRLLVPIVSLVVIVGVVTIFITRAATAPYTRLQCYGADHQGYKTVADCYGQSKEGITARSFIAVLGRKPELNALKYWTDAYSSFTPSAQHKLITRLLESAEAKRKFTALPSDTDRIAYLYNSVLQRKPDAAGATYWTARMKADNNWAQTITAFLNTSEGRAKTQAAAVEAINALPPTWYPTKVPPTVAPRGVYSNWQWQPPAGGYNSFEHTLVVDSYKPGSDYFWAHQFGFIGNGAGYIGLQSTSNRLADGTYKKQAVFSVFGAAIAAEPNICTIQQTGFDGGTAESGTSCIIQYNWVKGRSYRLKTALSAKDASGAWWSGWVIDTTTGAQTLIAKIKTPNTWKGLNSWSVMWTENFRSFAATCSAVPYSKVRFSKPLANGTITPAGANQYLSSSYECNNSRVTPGTSGVTQEVGASQ